MTSPPNFLSFAAIQNTSRLHSPVQSPFLSPFPSSPSSPGVEPRRTKSRHMDTFSFFDAKNQGAGSARDLTPPVSATSYGSDLAGQNSMFQQQPPPMTRWDSYGSNPAATYPQGRVMTPGIGRPMLPKQWLPQDPFTNDATPLASPSMMMPANIGTVIGDDGDEVISTAVVVKNIPFSLKKETLLELFDQMTLPKPYAFNYHFDNGTFRGLAFANFHSPEETKHVIQALNGYELIGRKLRVEYKKVLPADQRERIEMQKRQKAIQEEPMVNAAMRMQPEKKLEIDLNDPATLQIYSSLLLFRDDNSPSARTQMAFPPEFSPHQRRVVHLISQKLGLEHSSRGDGDDRYVVITKPENFESSNLQNRSLPAPLRIDTKAAETGRKTGPSVISPIYAPHLQPPGLNKVKSYSDIRAPSPLRTSAGSEYFSPPPQVTPTYASSLGSAVPSSSPAIGTIVNSLSDMTLNNAMPSRQPKGPEPKNAFNNRNGKKDETYDT